VVVTVPVTQTRAASPETPGRDEGQAMQIVTHAEGSLRRPYKVLTVTDGTAFGDYTHKPQRTALVSVSDQTGYFTSTSHEHGTDVHTLAVYSATLIGPHMPDHALHGTEYPTQDAAREAAYNAGLLGWMVYTD
jgi:hypothetical protein